MRRIISLNAVTLSLLVAVASSITLAAASMPDAQRRFEVRDSIEVAHFTEAGSLSPDGGGS